MAAQNLRMITLFARNICLHQHASGLRRLSGRTLLLGNHSNKLFGWLDNNYTTWSRGLGLENIWPAWFSPLPARSDGKCGDGGLRLQVEFQKSPSRKFSGSPCLQRTLRSFPGKASLRKGQYESKESTDESVPSSVPAGHEEDVVWRGDKGFAGTYRITDSSRSEADFQKPREILDAAPHSTASPSFIRSSVSQIIRTKSRESVEKMKAKGKRLDLHGWGEEGISPPVSPKRLFEKRKKELTRQVDDWNDLSEKSEKKKQKWTPNMNEKRRKEGMRKPDQNHLSEREPNMKFEKRRKETSRRVSGQSDLSAMEDTMSADLLDVDSMEWRKKRKGKTASYQGHKDKRNRKTEQPSAAKGNDVLYGISPCLLALQLQRREVHQVFVTSSFQDSSRTEVKEILAILEERKQRVWPTVRGVLDRFSHQRPHQGICMEVSRLYFNTLNEEDLPRTTSTRLVLDRIKDPMNLGAVLRSAYFLGVDQVIVSQKNCCSLTPVVSKASSGVMEVLPVYATKDVPLFLQEEQAKGWRIVGASMDGGDHGESKVIPCQEYEKTSPVILVIGNEGFGLSGEIKSVCSEFISIPAGRQLHSGIDSLNVSVATGILLHSLLGRKL